MAIPAIVAVTPSRGPTLGGELVRVVVRDAAPLVTVSLGGRPVIPTAREERPQGSVLWLAVPPLVVGASRLVIENLDERGQPIGGERAEWSAYEAEPVDLVSDGVVTRVTRRLLQLLRTHVVSHVRMATAVDFEDEVGDAARLTPIAETPSLTVSGPVLELNRFYAPTRTVEVSDTPAGPRVIERAPSLTVDLVYEVTGTSRSGVELLNLISAVATFLARTRWLALPRDPHDAEAGLVRWELDLEGGMRSTVGSADGVHVFTTQVRIRGVTLDAGNATGAVAPATNETQLELSLGGKEVEGG
jgi:hypothetical protein